MLAEVGAILRQAVLDGLLKRELQRDWVRLVVHAVAGCRTPAMGFRQYVCSKRCGVTWVCNQCRRRECPLCSGRGRWAWVEGWRRRMIPERGKHDHIVFTAPAVFKELWWHNRRALTKAMFDAAKQSNERWRDFTDADRIRWVSQFAEAAIERFDSL